MDNNTTPSGDVNTREVGSESMHNTDSENTGDPQQVVHAAASSSSAPTTAPKDITQQQQQSSPSKSPPPPPPPPPQPPQPSLNPITSITTTTSRSTSSSSPSAATLGQLPGAYRRMEMQRLREVKRQQVEAARLEVLQSEVSRRGGGGGGSVKIGAEDVIIGGGSAVLEGRAGRRQRLPAFMRMTTSFKHTALVKVEERHSRSTATLPARRRAAMHQARRERQRRVQSGAAGRPHRVTDSPSRANARSAPALPGIKERRQRAIKQREQAAVKKRKGARGVKTLPRWQQPTLAQTARLRSAAVERKRKTVDPDRVAHERMYREARRKSMKMKEEAKRLEHEEFELRRAAWRMDEAEKLRLQIEAVRNEQRAKADAVRKAAKLTKQAAREHEAAQAALLEEMRLEKRAQHRRTTMGLRDQHSTDALVREQERLERKLRIQREHDMAAKRYKEQLAQLKLAKNILADGRSALEAIEEQRKVHLVKAKAVIDGEDDPSRRSSWTNNPSKARRATKATVGSMLEMYEHIDTAEPDQFLSNLRSGNEPSSSKPIKPRMTMSKTPFARKRTTMESRNHQKIVAEMTCSLPELPSTGPSRSRSLMRKQRKRRNRRRRSTRMKTARVPTIHE